MSILFVVLCMCGSMKMGTALASPASDLSVFVDALDRVESAQMPIRRLSDSENTSSDEGSVDLVAQPSRSWSDYLPTWPWAKSQTQSVPDGQDSLPASAIAPTVAPAPAAMPVPNQPAPATAVQSPQVISADASKEVPGLSSAEAMGLGAAALGAAGAAAIATKNPRAAMQAARKAIAGPQKQMLITAGKPVVRPGGLSSGGVALYPKTPGGSLISRVPMNQKNPWIVTLPSSDITSGNDDSSDANGSALDIVAPQATPEGGIELHPDIMSPDMRDVVEAFRPDALAPSDSGEAIMPVEEPSVDMSADTERMLADMRRFNDDL